MNISSGTTMNGLLGLEGPTEYREFLGITV